MRQGIVLSNSWEHIGAMLANCEDSEQAAFFKGFVSELHRWPTGWAVDMQMAAIHTKLTDDELELLGKLS
uniref:Uncharacterized protein n=1 Tax=viral metagenome TaxID=1070528 RepID=A0A6H1ZNH2_9ZZZZ